MRYSQAFLLIAALHKALGLPSGPSVEPWSHQVDARWAFMLNRSDFPLQVKEQAIPPHTAALYFEEFPVGIVGLYSGMMMRSKNVSEDAFILALEGAIERASGIQAQEFIDQKK